MNLMIQEIDHPITIQGRQWQYAEIRYDADCGDQFVMIRAGARLQARDYMLQVVKWYQCRQQYGWVSGDGFPTYVAIFRKPWDADYTPLHSMKDPNIAHTTGISEAVSRHEEIERMLTEAAHV